MKNLKTPIITPPPTKSESLDKKLHVFESFSGIGAQHKALSIIKEKYNYDFEIVATSEWDIDAVISYAAIHYPNFLNKIPSVSSQKMDAYLKEFVHSKDGKNPIDFKYVSRMENSYKEKYYKAHKIANNLGSVVDITGKQLIDKCKRVDLITYSFPCQDLSVAGSFWGFNKGMNKEAQTRSSLLWQIGRIIEELNTLNKLPKFLLLENVPNMVSPKHEPDYIVWKKHLLDFGYKTKTYKLDARDFGIPQSRKRIYAISFLDDALQVDDKYEIICQNDSIISNQINKLKWQKIISLKNIIKNNYQVTKYHDEAIEATPNRTESRKRMFDDNFKLLDFDKVKYSRTVTTKQDRHPNAGVINLKGTILDENRNRAKANYRFITPREAYLLMGFDEKDFDKVKKQKLRKEKLYQQAGNSIVVAVILPVLHKILEIFNKE